MSALASKYNDAFTCIEEAKSHAQSGKLIEAKQLYVQGIEHFMEIMKLETNPARKQLLQKNIEDFIQKAEHLQSQIQHNHNTQNKNNKNDNGKDPMFSIAQRYLDEAVVLDRSNRHKEAINKYKMASQLFLDGMEQKDNRSTNDQYTQKISKILDRIQSLQTHASTVANKKENTPKSVRKAAKRIHRPSGFAVVPRSKPKHKKQIPKRQHRQIDKRKKASNAVILNDVNHEYTEPELLNDTVVSTGAVNIEDNWSSSDDTDSMDTKELIIAYATHFKLIWSAGHASNSLKTIVFEPILGPNEFMVGHLATNECANHKLLIVKKGGTDLDAMKPPKRFECIWCTKTPLCSFWRAIPLNGYAACGHIALAIEATIGQQMESYQVPKFVCIKDKYFCKDAALRSIRNIIWSSPSTEFNICEQMHFTPNILSAMFCMFISSEHDHELYFPLDVKYLKKDAKPVYEVIKSGFLNKKCKLKTKKRRYFVLTNENILYSYNIHDIQTKQINLKHVMSCGRVKRNKKGFVLATKDRKYQFEVLQDAQSNGVHEWIEAIQLVSDKRPRKHTFIDSDDEYGIDQKQDPNDYHCTKSEDTNFIEKLNKFEMILTQIEHMDETGANQQNAVQWYVELGTLIISLNTSLIKWSQHMIYTPFNITELQQRATGLFKRTINVVIDDIKWAANPNISEYAAARLTAACTAITSLDSGQTTISQYIVDELLTNAKTEFRAGNQYAKLEYIDRRFAEFKRKMKVYNEIYRLFVPEFWYLTHRIAAQFCIHTSESLEKELSLTVANEADTESIIAAKDKCIAFEQELTQRYHVDSSFFPKISDVLQLHLHFEDEVPMIKNILIHSEKKETMQQMKPFLVNIHTNPKTCSNRDKYLQSFDQLKETITDSIDSCFKKSNGDAAMKFIFNLALILEKYAFNLSNLLYIAGGKSKELYELIPKAFGSKEDTKSNKLIKGFHIRLRSESVNTNREKIQLFVIYCCLIYNTCAKVRTLIDSLLNKINICLMKTLQCNTKRRLYEATHSYLEVEQLCIQLMRSSIMYQYETYLFEPVLLIKSHCKHRLLQEFGVYLLDALHLLRNEVFLYFYTLFCGYFAKSLFDVILSSASNDKMKDFDVNVLMDFPQIFQVSAVHLVSIHMVGIKPYRINKIKLMIERFMNPVQWLIKLIYADISNRCHPKNTKFARMVREMYTDKNISSSFDIIDKIPSYPWVANIENASSKPEQHLTSGFCTFRLQSFAPIIPIQIKSYNKWETIQSVMNARKLHSTFQSQIQMLCHGK
eukprot:918425_1